jgi:hypothetical protein
MEIWKEVKTFEVNYKYDKCGKGFYEPNKDGGYLACNPPKYPHFCSYCDDRKDFRKTYPYITYEYKE